MGGLNLISMLVKSLMSEHVQKQINETWANKEACTSRVTVDPHSCSQTFGKGIKARSSH